MVTFGVVSCTEPRCGVTNYGLLPIRNLCLILRLFSQDHPEKMEDHMGFGLTHLAPYGVVTSHCFPLLVNLQLNLE